MMSAVLFAAALKVLMIGNSYSEQMVPQMPPIVKDLGLELDICSLFIGGCSLDRHWKNVENSDAEPYRVTWSWNGPFAWTKKNGNIAALLAAADWDVITIQQCSHESWKPTSYHPAGDKLVAFLKERAPKAKIVVQETWTYTPWDKRMAQWGLDQNSMYEKLHQAYAEFAAQYGFEIIPTGTAVQIARKDWPVKYTENSVGGDVVGNLHFVQGADGKWQAKGDAFHMGPDGNHMQALVWTAKLFGVDVTKCKYVPKGMRQERAEFLRKCAMKAVKGEK